MIIRLTQKLASKLKETPASSVSRDPDLFADWTANLFTANRVQYIILVNSATLYSVIMYGRGVTDGGIFIDRVLSALRDFMTPDDLPFFFHRFIVPQSATVSFSKIGDRSLLGSKGNGARLARLQDESVKSDCGQTLRDVWVSWHRATPIAQPTGAWGTSLLNCHQSQYVDAPNNWTN